MPPPIDLEHWTRDQMLAHAYARGGELRTRRRAVAVGAAGLAAAVLVLVLFGMNDYRSAADVHQVGPTGTVVVEAGTSTTTTTAAGAAVASTTGATARRTVGHSTPPSTVRSGSDASAVADQRPLCVTDIHAAIATDKPSYLVIDSVRLTAVVQNTGTVPCDLPTDADIAIIDPYSFEVADFEGLIGQPRPHLAPGESATYQAVWNQQCMYSCKGVALRGRYMAVLSMRRGYGSSILTYFTLD